jgi:hypothetical protein
MRDETRVLCYLPIANGVAVAFSSLSSNQGGVAVCTDTEEHGTEERVYLCTWPRSMVELACGDLLVACCDENPGTALLQMRISDGHVVNSRWAP